MAGVCERVSQQIWDKRLKYILIRAAQSLKEGIN